MNYTVPEPPLPSGIIRPMLARRHHFYTNPYLLLTLTALFWSGNMVLGRGIRADVPPLALAFWRWAIAFGLVLPLALPGLAAATLFTFVLSWNEVFASVILTSRNRTLPALLVAQLDESPLNYKYAGGFFLLAPSMVFMLFIRKYLFTLWGRVSR